MFVRAYVRACVRVCVCSMPIWVLPLESLLDQGFVCAVWALIMFSALISYNNLVGLHALKV